MFMIRRTHWQRGAIGLAAALAIGALGTA